MFPDDEITQTHAFTNVEIREMLPPEPSVGADRARPPKIAPAKRDGAAGLSAHRAPLDLMALDAEDTRVLEGKSKRDFDSELDESMDGVTGADIPAMPLDDALAATEPDRRPAAPAAARRRPSIRKASTERGGRPRRGAHARR